MCIVPEGGGLTVGLLAAPPLTLIQRQVADCVVSCSREVHIRQLFKRGPTWNKEVRYSIRIMYTFSAFLRNK